MDREAVSLLIKHVRLIDPANGIDTPSTDLVIVDGALTAIGPATEQANLSVLDFAGRSVVAMPSAIDLHVHFRDPGNAEAEDVVSGSAAALAGGFGHVVMMANTTPVIDGVEAVKGQREKAKNAFVEVDTVCALTKNLGGQELVDISGCGQAGAVAFTDDGRNLATSEIALAGLEMTAAVGKPLLVHAEDESMITVDSRPSQAEGSAIAKWIALLEKVTGARLHIQHISTAQGLRLVEAAKEKGLAVTCEVTPHHLALTQPAELTTLYKVNPPLRTQADVAALRQGLRDGVIDAIATDHAPHSQEAKARAFAQAPSGMIGLELAWPLLLQAGFSGRELATAVRALTVGPAKFLGIDPPTFAIGAPASLVLLDLSEVWTPDESTLVSGSRNTPLLGQPTVGRVLLHIRKGQSWSRFPILEATNV